MSVVLCAAHRCELDPQRRCAQCADEIRARYGALQVASGGATSLCLPVVVPFGVLIDGVEQRRHHEVDTEEMDVPTALVDAVRALIDAYEAATRVGCGCLTCHDARLPKPTTISVTVPPL